jgi:hypothetical protein
LIEALGYLNPGDPLPEKVISAQDATNSFATTAIYELPFGPGRPFASSTHGVLGRIVGGWQIQTIFQLQTGFPLDWGNVLFRGNLKDIEISDPTPDRWFNTAAGFERSAPLQLQSNLRTFPSRLSGVRNDTNYFFDFSVSKKTMIREGMHLMFYAEAFNVLNHPIFAAANTTPASTAFGTSTAQNNLPREFQMGLRFVF